MHFPTNNMSQDNFLAISAKTHISDPAEDTLNDLKKGTEAYDSPSSSRTSPGHHEKPLHVHLPSKAAHLGGWEDRCQIGHQAVHEGQVNQLEAEDFFLDL